MISGEENKKNFKPSRLDVYEAGGKSGSAAAAGQVVVIGEQLTLSWEQGRAVG